MLNEYAQISHQKFLAREREKLRTDKRLRDAAPDLLAALKEAATFLQMVEDTEGETQLTNANERIRAAIAKAEGTS